MQNEENKSFYRQLFVLSAFLIAAFNGGVILAFPGVLDSDLLSPNCTEGIRATKEELSWIATGPGISAIIGVLFFPIIMDCLGRKCVMLLLNTFFLAGWIIIVFANNVTWLLIGRSVQGIKFGGFVITITVVGEYVHPTKRGYFSVIKLAAFAFGICICHIMSMFWSWRKIAVFSSLSSLCACIIIIFWPESPPYLAMKGKFARCEESYVWLNGKSSKNNKELVELIEVQRAKLIKERKLSKKLKVLTFLKLAMSKDLLKPSAIVGLICVLLESSGRHYFVIYIIQILTELVGDQSLATYCSVAVDILVVFAILSSVFLVKKFKRRSLLLFFGLVAITLMFLMSLLLFLKTKFALLKDFPLLNVIILVVYCFSINVGIVPLSFALKGEIFPLKLRGVGSLIIAFYFTSLLSLTSKFLPSLIVNLGLPTLYAMFASIMLVCLVLLYFLLPETKDRNLQDIEFDITGEKICLTENMPINLESKTC